MTVTVAEGVKVKEAVPATYPEESLVGVTGAVPRTVPVELVKLTVPVGALPRLPPEGLESERVSTNAVTVSVAPVAIVEAEAVS